MPRKKGLTMREEMFCRNYIETFGNGTQSAIRAGIGGTYHSSHTASVRMLQRPAIRARIAELASGVGTSLEHLETMRQALVETAFKYSQSAEGEKPSMASVQAVRVLSDMLMIGESAERVRTAQDKIALERERIALERERLQSGQDKTVTVVMDGSLMSQENTERSVNPAREEGEAGQDLQAGL